MPSSEAGERFRRPGVERQRSSSRWSEDAGLRDGERSRGPTELTDPRLQSATERRRRGESTPVEPSATGDRRLRDADRRWTVECPIDG